MRTLTLALLVLFVSNTHAARIEPDWSTMFNDRACPPGTYSTTHFATSCVNWFPTKPITGNETPAWTPLPYRTTVNPRPVTVPEVPLPPAAWLFASALLGLGAIGRRGKKT